MSDGVPLLPLPPPLLECRWKGMLLLTPLIPCLMKAENWLERFFVTGADCVLATSGVLVVGVGIGVGVGVDAAVDAAATDPADAE